MMHPAVSLLLLVLVVLMTTYLVYVHDYAYGGCHL